MMTIHFYDGGYATCSEIEVVGDTIYWDGYRFYPLSDVEWIEDSDGSDVTADYLGYSNISSSTVIDSPNPQELDAKRLVNEAPEDYSRLYIEDIKNQLFDENDQPQMAVNGSEPRFQFVTWVGDSHSFIITDGTNEYRVTVTKELE